MGRVYYYYAASLPMLEWGKKPPMSTETFLEESRRLLAEHDFSDVSAALQMRDRDVRNPLLKTWLEVDRCLRNELVMLRARALNKDPFAYMKGARGFEAAMLEAVGQASKSADPLEGEKILDRARWQRLEELEAGHYFDLEFLIVYGLKLKILQRHDTIGKPQGRDNFSDLKERFVKEKKEF